MNKQPSDPSVIVPALHVPSPTFASEDDDVTGKKRVPAQKRAVGAEKSKNSRKYSAPALEKGLDILELFAGEPDGMIKSEVARRLRRTTSEVFRMLLCLQDRGYIRQDGGEKFRLTLRLFELAQRHPPTKRLIEEALPVMHDIAHRTNQSCHLAVIDGGVVVILAQVDAPSSIGFFVKPGAQVDLMSAASGYVILAFQHFQRQSRIVEQYRQLGGRIPSDLAAHLARVRRQGFEEKESYQVRGVVNISFPVLDAHGEAIAALTVPYLPRLDGSATDDTAVIDALRSGTSLLNAAMGYQEPDRPIPRHSAAVHGPVVRRS